MPLETFGVSPLYLTEQFHQTYAEKSFLNLVNPNQMWIVITIFRLILAQIRSQFGAKSIGKV